MNINRSRIPGKQGGAALVVGLILMVVITVLAISGMNTATTELAMARNDQSYENAFQAAETGLEMAISQGRFNTLVNVNLAQTVNSYDSVTAVINFEDTTLVPDRAFSMGVGSGIAAYHFNAVATAESKFDPAGTDRDASAVHTQAFYVVGPEAGSL
jgi:type IV pilus assembly protein PilX